MVKKREEKKAKVASLIIYIGLFRDIFGRKSLFDARGLFGEMFFPKKRIHIKNYVFTYSFKPLMD